MLPLVTVFKLESRLCGSPKHLLNSLEDVAGTMPEILATALCFTIDLGKDSARLSVASAGHPPLALIRAKGKFELIPNEDADGRDQRAAGAMIGLGPPLRVAEVSRVLLDGDMIVAFTDGISEAASGKDEFGLNGVMRAAINAGKDPDGVAKAIYNAAVEFAGGSLDDDASVIAIRVNTRTEHPDARLKQCKDGAAHRLRVTRESLGIATLDRNRGGATQRNVWVVDRSRCSFGRRAKLVQSSAEKEEYASRELLRKAGSPLSG